MQTLSALLGEADEIIQSKVAAGVSKTASASPTIDDDIFKLAASVRQSGTVKEAAAISDDEIYSVTEKIAHAAAIMDTWLNLETLTKLAELETSAKAKGFTDEQVNNFLEKNASTFELRSVWNV